MSATTTTTTSTVTVTPKRSSRESSPSGGLDALFADAGYTGSAISTGVTKPIESVETVEPTKSVKTTKAHKGRPSPPTVIELQEEGVDVTSIAPDTPLCDANILFIVNELIIRAEQQKFMQEQSGWKDHPFVADQLSALRKLYGFMTDGGACEVVITDMGFRYSNKSTVPLGKASAHRLNKIVSTFVSFLANRLSKIDYTHTSNTIITVRTGKTGGQRDKTVTTPGAALSKKARRKFDANQRARSGMRDAETGTIRVNSRALYDMCQHIVRTPTLTLAEKATVIRRDYEACKEIAHVVLDLADALRELKQTTNQRIRKRTQHRNTRRVE